MFHLARRLIYPKSRLGSNVHWRFFSYIFRDDTNKCDTSSKIKITVLIKTIPYTKYGAPAVGLSRWLRFIYM